MDNIIIREIQDADLEKGFLESLDNLKKASDLEINNAKTANYSRTWNCCYRCSIPLLKALGFRATSWGHNFEGRKLNVLLPSR